MVLLRRSLQHLGPQPLLLRPRHDDRRGALRHLCDDGGSDHATPTPTPTADTISPGTADECVSVTTATGSAGSQCDVFTNKCTLPYAQRTPVVIPWYLNGATTTTVDSLEAQIAASTDQAQTTALQAQLAAAVTQGEDLFEAINWAVQEWDLALKTAVQTARQVECKNTAGAAGAAACITQFPMWVGQQEDNDEAVAMSRDLDVCRRAAAIGSVAPTSAVDSQTLETQRTNGWTSAACVSAAQAEAQTLNAARGGSDPSAEAMGQIVPMAPVIVLCHNPVIQSDHPACGALGLAPRLGDIRYNTVYNIPNPQTPSAWGIMVDADDPLTGEKVAASINIWGAVTDLASQSLVDLVRYANGELTTDDITNGTYINNWANGAKLAGGAGPLMTKTQIHQRLAAGAGVSTQSYETTIASQLPANLHAGMMEFHNSQVNDLAISTAVASPSAAGVQARFQAMHDSATEAPLLNQAMLQRAGITGNIPQGSVADQASGVAMNNPRVASQLYQMREAAYASQGYCILEEAPEMSSLTGIADAMKRKFPPGANETAEQTATRGAAMVAYVKRRYTYAVLAHEMGHSVGLRHNFVSSYAALHYRPQYWQLRTANGATTTPCTDVVADGSTCTGPRYWDPLTTDEQEQMIWMFMQSSVMDYPGDVSQDTLGLGSYDFAAARMFYGDVTSVYDVKTGSKLDPDYLSTGAIGEGMLSTTDNFGGLVGHQVLDGRRQREPVPLLPAPGQLQPHLQLPGRDADAAGWWRTSVDGNWDQVFDGHVVSVNGKASKCRSLPVDYAGLEPAPPAHARRDWRDGRALTNYRGGNAVDPTTLRVRVPYSFASDNWADTGNTSVFRHDNGADPYEQLMFLITTQEDRHILDNFRRGRTTFNVRAAVGPLVLSATTRRCSASPAASASSATSTRTSPSPQGITFETLWPYILDAQYSDNMIGGDAGLRPLHPRAVAARVRRSLLQPAQRQRRHHLPRQPVLPSYLQQNVLSSVNDPDGNPTATALSVPEGSTGYLRNIGFGGHLAGERARHQRGRLRRRLPDQLRQLLRQDQHRDPPLPLGGPLHQPVPPGLLRRALPRRRHGGRAPRRLPPRHRQRAHRRPLAPRPPGHGGPTSLAPLVTNTVDPNDPTNKDALFYPNNPIGWTSWWPQRGPAALLPLQQRHAQRAERQQHLQQLHRLLRRQHRRLQPRHAGDRDHGDRPAGRLGGAEVHDRLDARLHPGGPADQLGRHDAHLPPGQQRRPAFTDRIEWQDPVSGELYYAKTYGHGVPLRALHRDRQGLLRGGARRQGQPARATGCRRASPPACSSTPTPSPRSATRPTLSTSRPTPRWAASTPSGASCSPR